MSEAEGLKVGDPCPRCGKPLVGGCDVPGCNGRVEVYSRIVGYFRPVNNWNDGKRAEFHDRKEFTAPVEPAAVGAIDAPACGCDEADVLEQAKVADFAARKTERHQKSE